MQGGYRAYSTILESSLELLTGSWLRCVPKGNLGTRVTQVIDGGPVALMPVVYSILKTVALHSVAIRDARGR